MEIQHISGNLFLEETAGKSFKTGIFGEEMVIAPVQENSGKQEKRQRKRKKDFRGRMTDSFSDSKHKGTSGREIFTILLKKSEKYDCGFISWGVLLAGMVF